MKICRRTSLAFTALFCLTFLGYTKGIDVSMAISGVCIGLAGANAFEKRKQ